MITVEEIAEVDFEDVSAFHSLAFGAMSYQAKPAYLKWLYVDHPIAENRSRGWVARGDQSEVVGVIHVMYLRGSAGNSPINIHSLQNLIVDSKLRNGLGMMLVKRALRAADICIFPGVVGDLANTYRAIRYEEVKSFWGRSIISPARAGYGMLLHKAGRERGVSDGVRNLIPNLSAEASKERDEILAERLNARAAGVVDWTPEMVRWRFFSANGPRHRFWFDRGAADRFCVVSLGIRHGVVTARLIEFGDDVTFLRGVLNDLRKAGVEVLLAFGSPSIGRETLTKLGLRALKEPPVSFLKRANLGHQIGQIELSGATTDVGFESIGAW